MSFFKKFWAALRRPLGKKPPKNKSFELRSCSQYESFIKYGLMIERLQDGGIASNIRIYGWDSAEFKNVDWTHSGSPKALIAMSVVIHLLQMPHEDKSPLSHLRTNRFKQSEKTYEKLPCGQEFNSLYVPIAYRFAKEYLSSDIDKSSLTIGFEILKDAVGRYMQDIYSDEEIQSNLTSHKRL
jgi:hypothetical protein